MFVPLALFMENNDLVKILAALAIPRKLKCVEDRKLKWVRGLFLLTGPLTQPESRRHLLVTRSFPERRPTLSEFSGSAHGTAI